MIHLGLTVGNDSFDDPAITGLQGAEHDAHAMKEVLNSRRAEVRVLTGRHATVSAVYDYLRKVRERLTSPSDLFTFYYAGHGKTVRSGGQDDLLMLLHNVSWRSLNGPSRSFPGVLSLLGILQELAGIPARRLLILDACRLPLDAQEMVHRDGGNTARSNFDRVFRDFAGTTLPTSDIWHNVSVLNSCRNGERAEELRKHPEGPCGVFTAAFKVWNRSKPEQLVLSRSTTDLELPPRMQEQASHYGSGDVDQHPDWFGEPITLPAVAGDEPVAPMITRSAGVDNYDQRMWDLVLVYDTEEKYRQYLEKIPNGHYCQAARDKLDDFAWAKACTQATVEAYEAYLLNPDYQLHAKEALGKIKSLRDSQKTETVWAALDRSNAQQLQSFLENHATSQYAPQAQWLLDELLEAEVLAKANSGLEHPNLQPLQTFCDLPDGPEMVLLPQGKFLMGSPASEEGRYDNEGPQHEVTIGYRLAMGKYCVTFDEWDACLADEGTDYCPDDEGWGRGRRPVINVSWEDARAYLHWLNRKLGIAEDSPYRYRLPSEAEWEYACRACTTGPFSFDGVIGPEKVNYDSEYTYGGSREDANGFRGKTVEVGSLSANPWGLHEVHGNVWEWVEDEWRSNYHGAPNDGSAWELMNDSKSAPRVFRDFEPVGRVLRGGSWSNLPGLTRSANRNFSSPGNRNLIRGFRVARMLPGA